MSQIFSLAVRGLMVCGRGTTSPLMPEDTSLPVPWNLGSFLPQKVPPSWTFLLLSGDLQRVALQMQSEWSRLGGQPCLRDLAHVEDPGQGKPGMGSVPFQNMPRAGSLQGAHPSRCIHLPRDCSPAPGFLSWLRCPRLLGSSTGCSVVSEWPWTNHTLLSVTWMICGVD